jgi:hypothetical protein
LVWVAGGSVGVRKGTSTMPRWNSMRSTIQSRMGSYQGA